MYIKLKKEKKNYNFVFFFQVFCILQKTKLGENFYH